MNKMYEDMMKEMMKGFGDEEEEED
jgi:hypothetical protein